MLDEKGISLALPLVTEQTAIIPHGQKEKLFLYSKLQLVLVAFFLLRYLNILHSG